MIKHVALSIILTACSLSAKEYHVSPKGHDENEGSTSKPFKTISAAADLAQPGDVITVHEGIYRERIAPPRGGSSDAQRITYRAADGEEVIIKGSEVVTGWTRAGKDVWQVVLPNSFFGDFNPFGDRIQGHWFNGKGRQHHSGAVYLNGHWLVEAENKGKLFGTKESGKKKGYLFNVAWMRTGGDGAQRFPTSAMLEQMGVKRAPCDEGGECIGFIEEGDWATYELDFGASSEHMQFRVASERTGGVIEVRLDSPDGKLLATCAVPRTGNWQKWRTANTVIEPSSGKQKVCLVFRAKTEAHRAASKWFAEVDESNTTLWAQFKGVDPNQELTEVNVRQTVFYPEKPGMHFITLRGFTLEHAATPWAPPTTEQIGLVGTHWSKGWIIENNTIRYSTCTGITLGKYNDPKDAMARATADAYNNTIEWAVQHGWTKDTVGGHIVRNNHIYHCEQAGIVGSLGAIFSTVTGNVIHDINQRRLLGGAEIAGVKFHAAIDSIISHNHIYRCHGTGGGIWLDWMAQGARVSGNLLHDNSTDLFFEVNHGPLLVDDNIFMSPNFLRDWSEGTAFVHNLISGKASVKPQGRTTPVHKPHSTQIVKLSKIACGDNRFYNNIFINGSDLKPYQKFSDSTIMQGNVFSQSTASLVDQADGTYLDLELGEPPAGEHPLVTSDLLGLAKVPNQRFEQPNGAAYRLDTDYFGKKRIPENRAPGPFAGRRGKEIRLKVWPTRQPKEKK
jgi:alpha-N-arabinofuranosidase